MKEKINPVGTASKYHLSKKWRIIIPVLLLITFLVPPVLAPATVKADDTYVNIEITALDIFAWLTLDADNVVLYIDGVPFKQVVAQLQYAIGEAVRNSVPNGRYSGVSSPGWEGYFSIMSNTDLYTLENKKTGEKISLRVYMGAGCGGKWGTSDGWPDLWSRRNQIGFYFFMKLLQWSVDDIVKRVAFLEEDNTRQNNQLKVIFQRLQDDERELRSINSQIDQKLKNQENTITSDFEQRLAAMKAEIKDEYDRKIWVMYGVFGFLFIVLIIAFAFAYRRKT